MSKGTQVYSVRLNADLVALARETIDRRNFWTRSIPWTFTDFLNAAIREKISKMKRSRRRGPRRQVVAQVADRLPLTLADKGANA